MSRLKMASIGLVLFCAGFYSGYGVYGHHMGKEWTTRVTAALLMAKSGGEAKETWMLAEILKGLDSRPQQQNREFICKLIRLKVSAMKSEHSSYLDERKGIDIPALSAVEEIYAKEVVTAEAAVKHSGCVD